VGFVARRSGGAAASAPATRSASLDRAISRLRSWDRCSEAVTVTTPAVRRGPRRDNRISRWLSEIASESLIFHESSARLSEVLTCWPPGPDDRENRQRSSDAGIVSSGNTSRSMQPASHGSGGIHEAVTVTVRVACTSPVTQCRKSMAIVYLPVTGGRSRKSNFSAAPDLRMLVSSGWPAVEG
jgi:hypothetical protein